MRNLGSKDIQKIISAIGLLGGLSLSSTEAHALVLGPVIGTTQSVSIGSPAQGEVIEHGPVSEPNCDRQAKLTPISGTIRGFSREDFTSGRYVLFINGTELHSSRISESSLPGVLSFSELTGQPYFPLSSVRGGDSTAGLTPSSRYPWSLDLGLAWDKRVRSVLVEVVESGQTRNSESYVVRDLVSYIDPRRDNCQNFDFEWKGFDQSVRNGFSLHYTPRHLTALAPIVQENFLVPDVTLAPGFEISSEPSDGCKLYLDLPSDAKAEVSADYWAFRARNPRAVSVMFCADRLSTELESIERKKPTTVTIDPSRNPLEVSLNYENISAKAQMEFRYRFSGVVISSSGIPIPVAGDWARFNCEARAEVDLDFDREALLFTSTDERVHTEGVAQMSVDRVGSGSLIMSNPLCGITAFDSHRSYVKNQLKARTSALYADSFNAGFSSGNPRHALTFAMDKAIYPLSTGLISPGSRDSGTTLRVTPSSVVFQSGNPLACQEGERGLFVMQSFRNTPETESLWNSWGSWNNDDLEELFGERRLQSTCPIVSRTSSGPVFDRDNAYEAPLLMSTGPLNQMLAARMGERLRWSLNTVTDSNGAAMASELGMEASESLSIEIESTLPPFVSPEWYFQAGHFRIRGVRVTSGVSRTEFEANSTFFLDQSLTEVLGLGVGNRSLLDDLLGFSVSVDQDRYVSTFHTVSSGSFRPLEGELRAAFETWLKDRLTEYLLDSTSSIGSVEYARTLPTETPFFSVTEGPSSSRAASVLVPYRFR